MRMPDLVLRGGRVIDPASRRDETADIALGDGKITEIARDLPASGAEIVDVRGLIVVPGLIDLHTHVYWGGTPLGVEAVEVARQAERRRSLTPAAPASALSTDSAAM
jgi:dihydroorotase